MTDSVNVADARFKDSFNRDAFVFEHSLHQHPLYDLDSLVGLARRLGPNSAHWSTRPIGVADGWEDRREQEKSLEKAVQEVEHANTLVVLKNIENDPVFGPVVKEALAGFAARVGPRLKDDMVHGRATLLVSSPRRITGYHIDAEANFLLQLRGNKTVYVFDGSDRSVVPDTELEAFYTGDLNGARYRQDQQDSAQAIDFRPGAGVHVPVEWPHWVQNGSGISVSISINYDLRSNARRARVFRMNRKLRKVGISPASPGSSAWRDNGKATLIAALDCLRARKAA